MTVASTRSSSSDNSSGIRARRSPPAGTGSESCRRGFSPANTPAPLAAAAHAEPSIWASVGFFDQAEYRYYAALAQSALCDTASAVERVQHLEALAAHHRQLREWAENCPENFETRAALVGAEIARLDGREFDAERLYEQAIRSARANGFVHNEALASEIAARFYAAQGLETMPRPICETPGAAT